MKSFMVAFEITKAFILQRWGADKVSLYTTELSPSGITEELLCLNFSVARDGGPEYVRRLGIPDELIEVMCIR